MYDRSVRYDTVSLIKTIFQWYFKHQRSLPWRRTIDPYHILVSEVMLQQTQVDRVIPKYTQFLHVFSSMEKLARAKTRDVIIVWKGLGYNKRGLFLQQTARIILNTHKSLFPCTYDSLIGLPGVGPYTARAILSFAFDLPIPLLDTNHRKFYQRTFFGNDVQKDHVLLKKAEEIIHFFPRKKQKGMSMVYHWNQALMDFMTAVENKDTHPFIRMYTEHYPETVKKHKKNAIPFKQTNRYIRGRIIDFLRDNSSITFLDAQRMFPDISRGRLRQIINQLAKDRLIQQNKQAILLP